MNIGIRGKIVGGFGAMLLALSLVGLTALVTGNHVKADAQKLEQYNKGAVGLSNAERALWKLRFGLTNFILVKTAEERAAIAQEGPKLYQEIDANLKEYKSTDLALEENEILKQWQSSFQSYFDT